MTAPDVAGLIRATFGPDAAVPLALAERFDCAAPVTWRRGQGTTGQRPAWLDWPSHTAAEMAREPWHPSVPRETKRKLG